MPGKQIFYLVAAVVGLVIPWYFNLQYIETAHNALDPLEFARTAMANPAAISLTVDVCVAACVFLAWMIPEARRLGMKHPWFYLLWTLMGAFASALPLFLFMRERKLASMQSPAPTP